MDARPPHSKLLCRFNFFSVTMDRDEDDGMELEVAGSELKEVESGDVIRVVLQFLRENSLMATFEALRQETGVQLNTVEDPSQLSGAIKSGQWDLVLREVATVELSDPVQQALFEQIALEMLDLRELDAAKKILKSSRALLVMRSSQPDRYARLEGIFQRGMVAAHEWPNGSKKKNRKAIARDVLSEISVVPPSRLLALMGQALKWQRHMGRLPAGMAFNIFRDMAPAPIREEEQMPSSEMAPLIFAPECRPLCCSFSPDGVSLATGSTDGFVELWNWMRGTLRVDLAYQARDELLMHSCDVLCLAWSRDSELLASADAKGNVKVWQISSGKCVRRFKSAHEQGITSVAWSSDSSKIVTSSLDGTVRMHGLRSGKTIKFFRGHASYVQRCIFAMGNLVSVSTDGTVKVWDKKSGDCTRTLTVAEIEGNAVSAVAKSPSIVDVVLGRDKEGVIIANRSNVLYRFVPASGELLAKYVAHPEEVEFVGVAVSSLGRYVYGTTSAGEVRVFDYETGTQEHAFDACGGKEVSRMVVHPHANILCTLPVTGNRATLWRPIEGGQ